jgi:hypothetical protein
MLAMAVTTLMVVVVVAMMTTVMMFNIVNEYDEDVDF